MKIPISEQENQILLVPEKVQLANFLRDKFHNDNIIFNSIQMLMDSKLHKNLLLTRAVLQKVNH